MRYPETSTGNLPSPRRTGSNFELARWHAGDLIDSGVGVGQEVWVDCRVPGGCIPGVDQRGVGDW